MPELDKLSLEFDELRIVFLAEDDSFELDKPDDLAFPLLPHRVQEPEDK